MAFDDPVFTTEIMNWLHDAAAPELTTRMLVALGNTGTFELDLIRSTINEIQGSNREYELLPTLVRLIGNSKQVSHSELMSWANSSNPIVAEAAIFGLAHCSQVESIQFLESKLESDSETIAAASIEALAKLDGQGSYDRLRKFITSRSLLVRSAFLRALLHIRPPDWLDHVPLFKGSHPLLRLCAARVFVRLASVPQLEDWLRTLEADEFLRIAADEVLYAPGSLAPTWTRSPDCFDETIARLPVRLTNFDPGYTWLSTNLDVDRQVDILVMNRAS